MIIMKYFNYAREEQKLNEVKQKFASNHEARMAELNSAIAQLEKLEESAENGKNENIAKELCDILNTI